VPVPSNACACSFKRWSRYSGKLDHAKLDKFKRARRKLDHPNEPPRKYAYALAEDSAALRLTGFPHGAITPLGSITRLPIVASHKAMSLGELYLGGGHNDLKLRIVPADLIKHFAVVAADIGGDSGDGDA
jgi:prolyl-tRNA editing enzyme YbaK/EbsC (Cys-tRNA(Pro) deacylase)